MSIARLRPYWFQARNSLELSLTLPCRAQNWGYSYSKWLLDFDWYSRGLQLVARFTLVTQNGTWLHSPSIIFSWSSPYFYQAWPTWDPLVSWQGIVPQLDIDLDLASNLLLVSILCSFCSPSMSSSDYTQSSSNPFHFYWTLNWHWIASAVLLFRTLTSLETLFWPGKS